MEYSRWQSAKVTAAITQSHANGVKFVLTVERMAWDDGGKAVTRALLGSSAARTVLVADIVSEIAARGVDGVSLDFEPLLSDQRANFAAFLGELRAGLYAANPAYQLTFAATGSQPTLTYQMIGSVTASGAADAVIIMGYPLRAIDARYAGGLAPMHSPTSYDLIQITNAYLNQTAADKIVMALPWYGRQWPTVTSNVNSVVQEDWSLYDRPHNIGYTSAIGWAQIYGRRFDPVEQSAWTVFPWQFCAEAPETWKQVYYDDVESLAYKYDWVKSKGLAGIGIWALGYDDAQPELWKLLRVKYRGLTDTVAPTGSVGLAPDEILCGGPEVHIVLSADDGVAGSGAVYVRLSNASATGVDGTLTNGRTYPTTSEIAWPMNDPALGGTDTTGSRSIYAQWRDVAGNWSPVTSLSFTFDLAGAASVSVASGAQMVVTPSVAVKVSQTTGRQISRVLVSSSSATRDGVLTSAAEIPLGQSTSFSLIDPQTGGSDADGMHTVYAQWQDSRGCWSTPVATSVTLDRIAPTGSLSIVEAPTVSLTGDVQLLVPGDDAGSGLATVELSNDGTSWQSMPATNDAVAWSAGAIPDGTWTISARWKDVAGNASDAASTTLVLDRYGPAGSLVVNGGARATRTESVAVQATAIDDASDVVELVLSNSSTQVGGVLSQGTSFTPGATIESWSLSGAGAPAGVADGTHTVYAQWRDGVGHWSDVVTADVMVDRTAPTLSGLVVQLREAGKLENTTAPIVVRWLAQDLLSGLSQQLIEVNPGVAPAGSVGPTDALSPYGMEIGRSASWVLRVTAVDVAGNQKASDTASNTVVVREDSPTAFTFTGIWKKALASSASGGSTRYATAAGATASWTFTGRSVAWVAPKGPRMGKAKVFIDGVLVRTVDLRSTANNSRGLVFAASWAVAGSHTIKIKVLGTSGRPRVDIDAMVVLN